MKIGLDISPLETGNFLAHRVRGTGFYIQNLKNSLLKFYPENQYVFFSKNQKIPGDLDVIHYPYFEPFFLTLPFKKQARTIVTVHDLTPLVFPRNFPRGVKGKLKWEIQKRILKRADAIIADSECSKKDIIKYADIDAEKVNIVYLAAGEEFKKIESSMFNVQSFRKKYNLPEKFVLYVGDVTWNKNLPRLLEVIKKINVPLVMVGNALTDKNYDKSNPWNQDLLKIQKMAEENKNISFLGFVPTDDLVMLYNNATLFVMPSIYEGFGLPVLEAMNCGCPVVTTRGGSLPEVAGKAAVYVDAYSIESISKGIEILFNNAKMQKDFSKKGIAQGKKFSWRKTAEETIKAYEKKD